MKQRLKDNWVLISVFLLLGIYYLYRMFAITPWYDEIYTYINFIDKGVLYSATNWPLPNNHVFFSMSSALLRWGGIYVGLRGISYLATLATILLLYDLFKKIFSKNISVAIVLCYSMLILSNNLAMQGRGYSLATFFLMLSVWSGYRICHEESKKKDYIFWGVALWLGLYTVVSSVYWVIAVCLCAGVILLVLKKYKKLVALVLTSLASAFTTLISYTILWLSVGAWQISNDVTSGYLGSDRWLLIRLFPRTCLVRGAEFMLADRSVQGIDRGTFLRNFKYFARDTISAFFGDKNMWYFYGTVLVVCVCLLLWTISVIKQKTALLYPLTYGCFGFLGIFVSLFVHSAYPFTRVFSFLGIFLIMPLGLLFGCIALWLKKIIKWNKVDLLGYLFIAAFTIFTGICLNDSTHMQEYDYTDYYAYDAIENVDWNNVDSYLVSDVYAEQQVEYHLVLGDGKDICLDTEEPDVIITKKASLTGSWPDIITDQTLEDCSISEREILYENILYIIYGPIN